MDKPKTTPPRWFKRTDRKILERVIASNGGGYDIRFQPDAPVMRLLGKGYIRMKPNHGTTCSLAIHTPEGLSLWRSING